MKRPSHIEFADKSLQKAFDSLPKGDNSERELYKFIVQAFENIEENFYCGTQIPKRLIPKEYKQYPNLWKYDLPRAWRLIYTVRGSEVEVISLVLEWLDHTNYERRFKY